MKKKIDLSELVAGEFGATSSTLAATKLQKGDQPHISTEIHRC